MKNTEICVFFLLYMSIFVVLCTDYGQSVPPKMKKVCGSHLKTTRRIEVISWPFF